MKFKKMVLLIAVLLVAVGAAFFFTRQNEPVLGDAVVEENGEIQSLAEGAEWDGTGSLSLNSIKANQGGVGGGFQDAKAEEVVRLVNEQRASHGIGALTLDVTMVTAAQVRAQEQAVSFSHTRPDGSSCFTVFAQFGIAANARGENLGAGGACPARSIVDAWMNSEGHRANILNPAFTRIAVGCYEANGLGYWSQLFAA